MALVIKQSLKERLLASAKQQAPVEETKPSLVTSVTVLAAAAKQEESNVVIDQPGNAVEPLVDMGVQQAYADVLPRIDALAALSGEALDKEMGILKRALIENPDACSLMLPKDIGKMVEALRRITGQALSDAVAKPKGGKKQKQLALTAEDMEKAFDEL